MLTRHQEVPVVSIVVPSYHSEATIEKTLAGLSRQEGNIPYEILVVNSSPDRTPEIVRTRFPGVKLIQRDVQTSAGEARNIGAAEARGAYLAFVDSDCVVVKTWLRSCLEHFFEGCGAIGGPIENANPESVVSCAGHILEFSQFYTRPGLHRVEHIPSGNIMLRADTFRRLGGYPVEFFPQEDRYFSWKLRRVTGKELLFHEDIAVVHHHRVSLTGFLKHQSRIGHAGAAILKCTDLPGSGLMKKRWLLNLALPFLPVIKLGRATARTLYWKPRQILRQPHVLIVLVLGMIWWMFGFAYEANRR